MFYFRSNRMALRLALRHWVAPATMEVLASICDLAGKIKEVSETVAGKHPARAIRVRVGWVKREGEGDPPSARDRATEAICCLP